MSDTATPTGAGKPARTSRQQALDEIERKRLEEVNSELPPEDAVEFTPTATAGPDGEALEDDEESEEDKADREATNERRRLARAAKKAQEEEIAAAGGETIGEDFLETKVKTKVDGVEEEVSIAELIKDRQKSRAADKRLEDAALTKKRAEEDAAATIAKANADAEEIRKKAGVVDGGEPTDTPAGISEAVALIYEGDQAKGADALNKAIAEEVDRRVKASGATKIDAGAIANEVRSQVNWDQEWGRFSADHQDVIAEIEGNPKRKLVWDACLAEAGQSSPASYADGLAKAAKAYRETIPATTGGNKVKTDDDTLAGRRLAKEEAAGRAVRSSTSVASGGPKADERPQTASEVIAGMAVSRQGRPLPQRGRS